MGSGSSRGTHGKEQPRGRENGPPETRTSPRFGQPEGQRAALWARKGQRQPENRRGWASEGQGGGLRGEGKERGQTELEEGGDVR